MYLGFIDVVKKTRFPLPELFEDSKSPPPCRLGWGWEWDGDKWVKTEFGNMFAHSCTNKPII